MMTSRILGTITGEGHVCHIYEDPDGRVYFTADADIDADGANGQDESLPAYTVDDNGSDYLANGGMKINNLGKVVCAHQWARHVVILDDDNEPKIFPGGIIASKTWYRDHNKSMSDPTAFVNSEKVPYIVVPPLIVQKTIGVVRGCKARATYQGVSVDCVVADMSASNRIGELSIAAARALGIPESPRNGGISSPDISYELWPGIPAPGYSLQPA